jgi:hypothetical protein
LDAERSTAARASASGGGTNTSRSSRPGRSIAGSTRSGRFVAPMTTTSRRSSTPSSSVSSAATTRSVVPPSVDCPRTGASASTSSRKTMAGDDSRARRNSSRTARSDSPTHLLSSSAPFTDSTLALPSRRSP